MKEFHRFAVLWGGVSDCVARDLIAASDVFVLPSGEEGFGLVVAESQACEVPVVATRMRPFDEVLLDDETGLLAELANPRDFANCILRLMENSDLRAAFGRRGRAFVTERFSQDKYVERVVKLYHSILRYLGLIQLAYLSPMEPRSVECAK